MNRRGLLSLAASLPFLGWVKSEVAPARSVVKIPYAVAGESVTCENGHHICDFLQTVYVGDIQNVETQIGNWQQIKVEPGTFPIPACDVCGSRWSVGVIYHFSDGWRDPLGMMDHHGLNSG